MLFCHPAANQYFISSSIVMLGPTKEIDVFHVWLQMGNGNVEGRGGKKVCTLNISSVVRLPEFEA